MRVRTGASPGRDGQPRHVDGHQPESFFLRYLGFTAQLWGDPDPLGQNTLYDFNTCIELERELLGALRRNAGNTSNLRVRGASWQQDTDNVRRGRILLLDFAIGTPVVEESEIFLLLANPGVPGTSVEIDATLQMQFPDGQAVPAGVVKAP